MLQTVIPILIALGGVFALFCSFKNYDWFMEHRRARAISAIIGRTGTRMFYGMLAIALVVVGVVLIVNPPEEHPAETAVEATE
jgi:hypothetical protein